MDPFLEVFEDARQQYETLRRLEADVLGGGGGSSGVASPVLITENTPTPTPTTGNANANADVNADANARDFENNLAELKETIEDLRGSVQSSRANPDFFKIAPRELERRETALRELERDYAGLVARWNTRGAAPAAAIGESTTSQSHNQDQNQDHDRDRDRDNGELAARMANLQQQQLMQEQDSELEHVYQSMQNINQQARMMGTELEEQAFMLEGLEEDLDRVGAKLARGMRRVEHVIRANQERASDCCIALLVVALLVLLVLVMVV